MNVDEYNRLRNVVIRTVNSQEFTRHYGRGDSIKRAIDTMIKSLDVVARGGRTSVGQNMTETVRQGAMVVMEKAIYGKHDRFTINFSLMFADLLTMFNKELAYNFEFDIFADAIRSIVRSHLTITEAIDVLRNLLDRAEKYLRLEPPAYEISRHFVEMVWKKLESGEEVGDYPNKAVEFKVQKNEGDKSKKCPKC